jgi:hypothetical protein
MCNIPAAKIGQTVHREAVLVALAPVAQAHDMLRQLSACFPIGAMLRHRSIDVEGAHDGRQSDFMCGCHTNQHARDDVVPVRQARAT